MGGGEQTQQAGGGSAKGFSEKKGRVRTWSLQGMWDGPLCRETGKQGRPTLDPHSSESGLRMPLGDEPGANQSLRLLPQQAGGPHSSPLDQKPERMDRLELPPHKA